MGRRPKNTGIAVHTKASVAAASTKASAGGFPPIASTSQPSVAGASTKASAGDVSPTASTTPTSFALSGRTSAKVTGGGVSNLSPGSMALAQGAPAQWQYDQSLPPAGPKRGSHDLLTSAVSGQPPVQVAPTPAYDTSLPPPGSMTVGNNAADAVQQMAADTSGTTQPLGPLPPVEQPPTAPPAKSERTRRSPGGKSGRKRVIRAKSDLGRAFLDNGPVIVIQAQSIISMIDIEIARVQGQKQNARRNDPDSNAQFDAPITFLDALKTELAKLQKAAVDFPEGKVVESKLDKVVKGFGEQFGRFWGKDGAKLIGETATLGLICGGFILLSLVGMPVPFAATFAGAVCAHKPISKVLKASKGLFNVSGSS
jgi:hypothetical protein